MKIEMDYKNDESPTTCRLGWQFNFQIRILKNLSSVSSSMQISIATFDKLFSLCFMSAKKKLSPSFIYPAYLNVEILWKGS